MSEQHADFRGMSEEKKSEVIRDILDAVIGNTDAFVKNQVGLYGSVVTHDWLVIGLMKGFLVSLLSGYYKPERKTADILEFLEQMTQQFEHETTRLAEILREERPDE
jgi:HrpA-like RNA helicase